MGMPDNIAKKPRGEPSFAGSAFERYHGDLQRFLMRRLRSVQNAQDVAQETYLRLLRLDRGELVRKPQAYLYRVAANLVYEFKLREANEPVTFDSEALDRAAEHPAELPANETGERVSVDQQLEAVLMQLPPLYRAVFVLRKRDGQSYPEIANTLGISVHTVKKYLARAVAQCRAAKWTSP
jgi:RNA polymerase sigma factor (sigma-70 family)